MGPNLKTSKWYDSFYINREELKKLTPWHSTVLDMLKDVKLVDWMVLDLGTGTGELLREVKCEKKVGVDISFEGLRIAFKKDNLNNYVCASAEHLPFKNHSFDLIFFCEVIEHVNDCNKTLNELKRVLKKEGFLIISFPNYIHLAWLVLRILADILNKPKWIVRQPIDRIFFYPSVKKMLETIGFKLLKTKGSVYAPPVIYNYINYEYHILDNYLDRLKLYIFAFHPVLLFKYSQSE